MLGLGGAGVERFGALAGDALLLDDDGVVQLHDDVLDLVDLVPGDQDEAGTVSADQFVLGARVVDTLDAVRAAALAEVRVDVAVIAVPLRLLVDALVDLAEEHLVVGQPPLVLVRHEPRVAAVLRDGAIVA